MRTRKNRRGGNYIENTMQLVKTSVFGLKIAVKTAIAATTTIPQELLHQYIYSKFRGIFSVLYAGFYNVQREVLKLLETKEVALVLKKLDINKSEFIKVVKKALDFIKRCLSSQSLRSITEWFPIAVELMRVSKVLIKDKVNPDFVERVSALMELLPPKMGVMEQMDSQRTKDTFFKEPNTNPSESSQQWMDKTKTLFENLVHDRPLLEGLFETEQTDTLVEGLEKTVSGPAISAVQTLIDEILYLYVADIGNLYTKIYSSHEDLRDAIVKLIDKGIYMACISQLVPIKPKDIEDLKRRKTGGNKELEMRKLKVDKKATVKKPISKPPTSKQQTSKSSIQDSKSQDSKPSIQDSKPQDSKPDDFEYTEGEIATIMRLSATKLPKDLELIVFLISKL